LTSRNSALHQFGFSNTGKSVFVSSDDQGRHVEDFGLQPDVHRRTRATSSEDIFRIMRKAPSTRSGRVL
jgi:hypothetical protein